MIIVITDACLLIDLIDIELFHDFLQLGYQIHITSSVLAELEGDQYEKPIADSIKKGGLSLHHLTSEDQTALGSLMINHSSRLSEPDCSCLLLALKLNGCILTCEKLLTKEAKKLMLDVHGSLWVIDQLLDLSIITKRIAYRKLSDLMKINSRLPKKECKKRLKKWL